MSYNEASFWVKLHCSPFVTGFLCTPFLFTPLHWFYSQCCKKEIFWLQQMKMRLEFHSFAQWAFVGIWIGQKSFPLPPSPNWKGLALPCLMAGTPSCFAWCFSQGFFHTAKTGIKHPKVKDWICLFWENIQGVTMWLFSTFTTPHA